MYKVLTNVTVQTYRMRSMRYGWNCSMRTTNSTEHCYTQKNYSLKLQTVASSVNKQRKKVTRRHYDSYYIYCS